MKKLIFLICTVISVSLSAEVIDRVVAVVNDLIITQSDLVEFQRKLKTNGLVDESLINIYDRSRLIKDQKYLVQYLIDERMIDSEIKSQGLVSPIEQVESEIRNIARSRNIDRNQLKLALKNQGVAYSDYQDFIKTSLQRQTLLQREVTSKIKISDEEITSFYARTAGPGKALVFEYTLSHIVFLNSNGGKDEAEKRANDVLKRLNQNIPFESLAAQYSEDPQFSQGGLFGTFRVSDFNKEVGSVIRPLNVADISPVVRMDDGFRIFKVLKKTLVPSPDLEAKREDIRRILTSESFKKQYLSWIQQRRQDSYIKINAQ